jgi:hypothetical protein
VSDHRAPSGWLERWQEAEPVRLYLWSVAAAVITAATVAGWLTAQLSVAVTGVAAAVLMFPAAAAARRRAWSPRSVHLALQQQADRSYEDGARGMYLAQQATTELEQLAPETAPLETVTRCRWSDGKGRWCSLGQHPRTVAHKPEAAVRK